MGENRRDIEGLLDELGRAERAAAPGLPWARLEPGLSRAPLAVRLPLFLASSLRQLSDLARPAVAGGVAATLAGFGLGTWLALASTSPPSISAESTLDSAGLPLVLDDEARDDLANLYLSPEGTLDPGLEPAIPESQPSAAESAGGTP